MTVLSHSSRCRRLPFAGRIAPLLAGLAVLAVECGGRAESAPTNTWTRLVGWVDSSPAIGADGTLYFGNFSQKFFAVATNGVIRWTFNIESEIRSSPAIGSDGTIYFGSRDWKLYALTPEGRKKWEFTAGAWIDASPALGRDGAIYFGSWDGNFYALNPDGSLRWRFHVGAEIDSSAAIGGDGTIYFGAHDKKAYALNPDGGKRWEYATGGQIISSPALNGQGMIYFTSVDGFLYALNESGNLVWRLRTGGYEAASPVVAADGTIYASAGDGLWSVTADGKKKWEWPVGRSVDSTPVLLAGDAVCFYVRYAELWKLAAERRVIWSLYLDPAVTASIAVGSDGTLYAVGRDQLLRAMNATSPLAPAPWPRFHGNSRNTGNVADAPR